MYAEYTQLQLTFLALHSWLIDIYNNLRHLFIKQLSQQQSQNFISPGISNMWSIFFSLLLLPKIFRILLRFQSIRNSSYLRYLSLCKKTDHILEMSGPEVFCNCLFKNFTFKLRLTNVCRKFFQRSKTAFQLSFNCHVSWDNLYI